MSEVINPLSYKLPEEEIFASIYKGDVAAVKDLFTKANTGHPLFMGSKLIYTACTLPRTNPDVIEQLLLNGVSPNTVNHTGLYKDTSLHIAAKRGDLPVVKLLLQYEGNVMATNRFGQTPLHCAAQAGREEVILYLLDHGSVVDYKDCGECTPLFHAVSAGQTEAVRILIQAGCNLDTLNDEQLRPLDQALFNNNRQIISLLLKGGCQIEKTSGYIYYTGHYCNSVLYSLLADGDIENIKLLLNCGYQLNHTALRQMSQMPNSFQQSEEVTELLQEITSKPLSLYCWSRIAIRQTLNNRRIERKDSLEENIDTLPLPEKIRDYLAFRDE